MIKYNWIPKAPGGGGFGCQLFSLGTLYTDWVFKKNIWTHTNIYYDLVRYLGVRFTFYRHPETDFIIAYDNQPPFDIQKLTYMYCHPSNLLLAKHKKILLSAATNPRGRLKLKMRIRPPKQMITKWFFSKHFSSAGLCLLKAAAMQTRYANLGCCNTNRLITFYSLNTDLYAKNGWGNPSLWGTHGYQPYGGAPTSKDIQFKGQTLYGQTLTGTISVKDYKQSITYENGWFQKNLLQIAQFTTDSTYTQLNIPISAGRYNPELDTGEGNTIWLVDILSYSICKASS